MKITKVDNPSHVGITFMIEISYIELIRNKVKFTGKFPRRNDNGLCIFK